MGDDNLLSSMIKEFFFNQIATMCEDLYGIYYDREEMFFSCPHCGEPIYLFDYIDDEKYVTSFFIGLFCPVCEISLDPNEDEEDAE